MPTSWTKGNPKRERAWLRAKRRVSAEYPDVAKDSDRYYALTMSIAKNMSKSATLVDKLAKSADLFQKAAESRRSESGRSRAIDVGLGAGGLYGSKRLLDAGLERSLGVQRFVHGTSDVAIDPILSEGLSTRHGSSPKGSTVKVFNKFDTSGSKAFINNAKGRIYVSKDTVAGRIIAKMHAGIAGGDTVGAAGLKALIPVPKLIARRKGSIIGGAMPHSEFHSRFELDPDWMIDDRQIPAAMRSKHDMEKKYLSRGRAGTRDILKNVQVSQLGKYLRSNPKRVLIGLAFLGGSGALSAKSVGLLSRKREAK